MSATYYYQHNYIEGQKPGDLRTRIHIGILILGLGLFLSGQILPMILLIEGVILTHFLFPKPEKPRIEIYDRYLICGTQIIYFRNVISLKLNQPIGRLDLIYKVGEDIQNLTIHRKHFPDQGRQTYQMQNQKQQTFSSVSHQILQSIQQQNSQLLPEVIR